MLEKAMPEDSDKSDKALLELVRVLEEAVQEGANTVELEFDRRKLIVYHRYGNTALGAARIPQELQRDVINVLVKKSGLSRKPKGKMQVRLLGKNYEVIVEEYDSFGESAFTITLKERKKKKGEGYVVSGKRCLAQTNLLFQFKITLLDVKPSIWRRIQVPDCTLVDLHGYIQAAFGWENYHLHQFQIDGVWYSQPAPVGDDFGMDFDDETDVLLSKLLPKSSRKARWIYEYDFGDGWRHEVSFEGFPPIDPKAKGPLCLEGGRACPPEDCGGPPGYASYIAAIADPQHEQHEEMLRWRGPFDPEAFDAKKAAKKMRKVK
jgi:hypothetical protein